MKVTQENTGFRPITITLESPEEVELIRHVCAHALVSGAVTAKEAGIANTLVACLVSFKEGTDGST